MIRWDTSRGCLGEIQTILNRAVSKPNRMILVLDQRSYKIATVDNPAADVLWIFR